MFIIGVIFSKIRIYQENLKKNNKMHGNNTVLLFWIINFVIIQLKITELATPK